MLPPIRSRNTLCFEPASERIINQGCKKVLKTIVNMAPVSCIGVREVSITIQPFDIEFERALFKMFYFDILFDIILSP